MPVNTPGGLMDMPGLGLWSESDESAEGMSEKVSVEPEKADKRELGRELPGEDDVSWGEMGRYWEYEWPFAHGGGVVHENGVIWLLE